MTVHRYEAISRDGSARRGKFHTPHGSFETPNFMPVGTRGSVKGVDCERLKELGTQITLVNTYHLWLRPGPDTVSRLGGIHRFCSWNGPILSDSGGFQVFSLKGIRKISEEGVQFQSHIDGKKMMLTPERSIEIQETLGVDIAMAFDECPSADMPPAKLRASIERTHRWALRCLEARKKPDSTALFGITQGAGDRELRTFSAEAITSMDFDGFAIGGLSVGEPKPVMYGVLNYHVDQLPYDKIRYLMGVGTPEDVVQAVSKGVDLFDCVMPTRAGRFGRAYINGPLPYINIKNKMYREQNEALDPDCGCLACRSYSRAYIHHLFRVGEMLGPQLLSIHNLTHYMDLMQRIRLAIEEQSFERLYEAEKRRWNEQLIEDQFSGAS